MSLGNRDGARGNAPPAEQAKFSAQWAKLSAEQAQFSAEQAKFSEHNSPRLVFPNPETRKPEPPPPGNPKLQKTMLWKLFPPRLLTVWIAPKSLGIAPKSLA